MTIFSVMCSSSSCNISCFFEKGYTTLPITKLVSDNLILGFRDSYLINKDCVPEGICKFCSVFQEVRMIVC